MLKSEAAQLRRHPPQLWPGETLPDKPVYWLIWILDDQTQKPYHSRISDDKWLTPVEASEQCYGIIPSKNMRFFNLTSTVVGMRKRLREIAKLLMMATK